MHYKIIEMVYIIICIKYINHTCNMHKKYYIYVNATYMILKNML